ncbi:MAG: putative transporter permease protein [Ilumatobacteraceae bacterium]|nr:putative transporter permease protein [Ilumatobacteraceae bacterium]
MVATAPDPTATGSPRAPRDALGQRSWFSAASVAVAPVLGITLFLLGWQAATKIFDIKQYELPTPSSILSSINGDKTYYLENARTTLWEAFLGFAVAFGIAMVVAAIIAHSRVLERMLMPLVVLAQVTPLIAYAPAFVIWMGFGLRPIVTMTAIVCGVPFLVNATTGLRSVDPNLIELARSVDASKWEVFVRLRLPSALPNIFTAARIAVGLALMGAVLGEFFAGSRSGLGYSVKVAQNHNLPLQLWGSVYVLAVLGALAIILISGIERYVLHWHASQRR